MQNTINISITLSKSHVCKKKIMSEVETEISELCSPNSNPNSCLKDICQFDDIFETTVQVGIEDT